MLEIGSMIKGIKGSNTCFTNEYLVITVLLCCYERHLHG